MMPGALGTMYDDRPTPMDKHLELANNKFEGAEKVPLALRVFGAAGFDYQEKYGASNEMFAKVRAKASNHTCNELSAMCGVGLAVTRYGWS